MTLWSWHEWSYAIPAAVGTHWSSNGTADRTTPTGEFFAATFAVSAAAGLVGAAVALLPRVPPLVRRLILLAAGSVSAVAATQWLVSAGATIRAGDHHLSVLGAGILAVFAAFAYGVIPLLLAPPAPAPRSPAARTSP